jgi:type I restriction enzyme S subunit
MPFTLRLREESRGTAQGVISRSDLAAIPIWCPPLAEQHRIVTKVDELMALCDRLEAARKDREAKRDRLSAASLARLNTPDPETFTTDARFTLNALPALTTRPNQIKQLRQTILNLAVRGKLVPQDPNDEPASEFLKQVNKERIARVRMGELRKTKGITPPSPSTPLFKIPAKWEWSIADQLWDFENGDRSSNYPSRDQLVVSGIPFINAGHLVGGRVSVADMNYITPAKFMSLGGGKLRQGDQIYCLRGSLGKHAVFDLGCDAAIASSLVILRPVLAECVPYLSLYLDSDVAQTLLRRFDNGSAQPNLSSANLRKYEIPLPPLAEQHRIVAKVDELMALCDRLEASLTTSDQTRTRLLEATLAEALAPASISEMEAAE